MIPRLGCASVLIIVTGLPFYGRAADETSRLTRTVTLPRDAAVTIAASVGEIAVTGWERPETTIEIVRRARTAALLATVEPAIDDADGRLSITALQPGDRFDRSITTVIRINTPQTTAFESVTLFEGRIALKDLRRGVSVNCQNGSIDGSGLQGRIRLETLTGNIDLDAATLDERGFIRLRTFNGQVRLKFASRPHHARILALSFNGKISSDIPLTTKDRFGPRFAEATIGTGEPVVSIDVVTGDIEIKAPPER